MDQVLTMMAMMEITYDSDDHKGNGFSLANCWTGAFAPLPHSVYCAGAPEPPKRATAGSPRRAGGPWPGLTRPTGVAREVVARHRVGPGAG